ncbi:Zinc finger MYM-type protein 1 [Holothuria leucospilota]|uniref:Zinc finger MYM-type protein 1 n=1 Tax=Holothuria leucospilota TaxID=206669 RepID=A0A9Q0YNK0_HOLLE|nr:Zinc finger MYM-type protein 1 [Holothuria leucospilota]
MKLAFFGKTNIAEQLSAAYRTSIQRHNLEVEKNRHVLSKIIDCIKFCAAFELALRGHDETDDSENPGVFLGLVNFTRSLDSVLSKHLETATVFKGTSKTIQNEVLDIMFKIAQSDIQQEIKDTNKFLAVISDDTTDVSNHLQNVVILRYLVSGQVVERFWSFCSMKQGDAVSIANVIDACLSRVLPNAEDKSKLIAQCYDGASVMSGLEGGVQSIVKQSYPHAHYVHCYAHQLNLVLQQAVSQVSQIRLFFANLSGFSVFFTRSPKRVAFLDKSVGRRLPRSVKTRWNFQSRLVLTVYEHQDDLIECFQDIIVNWNGDQTTVREASGLLKCLQDRDFLGYLDFFHKIMPHVEILYAQLQRRQLDPVFLQNCKSNFIQAVNNVRSTIPHIFPPITPASTSAKRPRVDTSDEEKSRILHEVSDIIISHFCSRFEFSNHLASATLFNSESFEKYNQAFPSQILKSTAESYPMLDESKLRSELSVIYSRCEFRQCCGAVALLHLLQESNLTETFSQVIKLLMILITTPMSSSEAERCFSTLKRVKTFLRNTMSDDRLNALAMLSIEKKFIRESSNFNQRVIEMFAHLKERRATFLYK